MTTLTHPPISSLAGVAALARQEASVTSGFTCTSMISSRESGLVPRLPRLPRRVLLLSCRGRQEAASPFADALCDPRGGVLGVGALQDGTQRWPFQRNRTVLGGTASTVVPAGMMVSHSAQGRGSFKGNFLYRLHLVASPDDMAWEESGR